jgi:hypothetical protein
MPIRFRCPHCDQLLGIARRKAGAQVRCPSCRRDVAVPADDEPSLPEAVALPPPVVAPPAPPPLFERDDFDQLLHGSVGPSSLAEPPRSRGSAVRTPVPAPRPIPPPVAQPAEWSPGQEPMPPGGVLLTPARVTVLTVVMILLLALAFALGLVVGRFVL